MPTGTWKGSGTFTTTGPAFSDIIQIGALIGVAIGAALIIEAFMWEIAVIGTAALAARLYILYRKTVILAQIHAKGLAMQEEQRTRADACLADQRRHELEVARVSAPVIQPVIQNIIDPAMITAALVAAVTGAQPQPVRVIPAIAEEVHDGR